MSKEMNATQVAAAVGVSVRSIRTWYKWYQLAVKNNEVPEGCPGLPEYTQAYPRALKIWTSDDIDQIKAFHEWMPKGRGGVMGNVNARNWGDRGRRALANKRLKKDE